ncbi:BamA/TamA family outer membrane protein [Algoriphagus aestuarii]|nr:BamA/TamA family outer membrane protein [Algoriphagus aestuarii]
MVIFNHKSLLRLCVFIVLTGFYNCISHSSFAQKKKQTSLKDEEDGKFDLSNWIIEANGFVPIPLLITEPALGGFGGAMGLAFLNPVPGSPPNITTVLAGYTANKTWFVGGIHTKNIPEKGIKYRYGTVYANVNISLFRDIPVVGEQEFKFNFKMLPVFFEGTKQLGKSNWRAGFNYTFLWNRVGYNGELPDFVPEKEIDSHISMIAPVIQFDSRDNIFTPNRGTKVDFSYGLSQKWTGSDYEYSRLNLAYYSYWPVTEKWILGLRAEYQQVFNSPPFYLLPGINLRGVPAARYQGLQTTLSEIENRFDISSRSSIMAFGGLAKAFNGFEEFGDSDLAYNIGTGYRYLIARKFGLRMGMDVAFGPDDWGYYIIFGSNWLR